MKLGKSLLFLLFIFSIPVQLGKHFWPSFSFVNGIRIDYLSPTLYVSDITFFILFIFSIVNLREPFIKFVSKPLFVYTTLVLLIACFLSLSPQAALFKLVKLFELFYLSFFVSKSFNLNIKEKFLYILTLGGLVECIILYLQFISQHSLDGVFYYLGERTIGPSSIGAAVFSFNNSTVLRPYGTFPHPNVLAFYLLFPFTYLLFSLSEKHKILRIIAILAIVLGIILTFSRIILLIVLAILTFYFYATSKNLKRWFLVCLMPLGFLGIVLYSRFMGSLIKDFMLRIDLLKIAYLTFLKFPLVGIGLNNFFFHEIYYQKNITPTLLQPVHSIYVLWLVETGILGSIPAVVFLKKTLKISLEKLKSKISFNKATSLLLFSSLIIGFFDHYLLTLQQGQLLFSLLIGLIWNRLNEQQA